MYQLCRKRLLRVFYPFLNQISIVAVKVRNPSRILDLHAFSQTHDWHAPSPICSSLFTLSSPVVHRSPSSGWRPFGLFCLPCLSPESFTARARLFLFGRRRFRLHRSSSGSSSSGAQRVSRTPSSREAPRARCLASVLRPRAHDAPSSSSRAA